MTHRDDTRAEHAREVRAEAAEAKAEAKADAAEAKATAKANAAARARAKAAKELRTTNTLVFGALASLITQSVCVDLDGAEPGDVVHATPLTNLGNDSFSWSAIVLAPDKVSVRVHNTGLSMAKPDDCAWSIVVFPHD